MKSNLLLAFILVFASLTACDNGRDEAIRKADSIRVSDISTACECVDAANILGDAAVVLTDQSKGPDELAANQSLSNRFCTLSGKVNEIENRCMSSDQLGLSRDDLAACDGFGKSMDLADKINPYWDAACS